MYSLLAAMILIAAPAGDAARGEHLYQQRCAACHSPDANRVGPAHRGVFGRKSASAPGFSYSSALKNLNVTWNAQTLDRWLANPTAMAPGTAMAIRVADAQDRADLIVFLKSLKAAKP